MAELKHFYMEILTTPPPPAYLLLIIAKNGAVISSLPIKAADDEAGCEQARQVIAEHAVELWDGLRFINRCPTHR